MTCHHLRRPPFPFNCAAICIHSPSHLQNAHPQRRFPNPLLPRYTHTYTHTNPHPHPHPPTDCYQSGTPRHIKNQIAIFRHFFEPIPLLGGRFTPAHTSLLLWVQNSRPRLTHRAPPPRRRDALPLADQAAGRPPNRSAPTPAAGPRPLHPFQSLA